MPGVAAQRAVMMVLLCCTDSVAGLHGGREICAFQVSGNVVDVVVAVVRRGDREAGW